MTVYCAWQSFRKGKKPSLSIDTFAYDVEDNVLRLSNELTNRSYQHGGYKQVIVHEKKRRDLAVATVRDRVVHRLLYDYLAGLYDKSFDPDVWSCRIDKGLHRCLDRTRQLLRRHNHGYVWRADITKFFDSVDHQVMLDCLERKLGEYDPAIWLCAEVIESFRINGAGIPIGNLTSQIFSNIYLNQFDRFVRHQLKSQAYLRYGDDFLLFLPSRRQAYLSRQHAVEFLADYLKLSINPRNDVVIRANSGLKFLGHAITEDFAVVDKHTTKLIVGKVNSRNISSYKAMPLVPEAKNQLDWILLEKYVDV